MRTEETENPIEKEWVEIVKSDTFKRNSILKMYSSAYVIFYSALCKPYLLHKITLFTIKSKNWSIPAARIMCGDIWGKSLNRAGSIINFFLLTQENKYSDREVFRNSVFSFNPLTLNSVLVVYNNKPTLIRRVITLCKNPKLELSNSPCIV